MTIRKGIEMNIRSKTLDKLTFFALFLVMIIPLEVWAQEGGNAATKAEKVPPASEIVSGKKKDAETEEMDKADDPAKVNFSRSPGAVLAALENREKLEEAKGGNKLQFLLALGEWDGLREAFRVMEKDKAKAFYIKMLTDLQKQAAAKQNNKINKDAGILGQDDLIALTDCSPINPGEVMDPLAALYGAVLKDDPDMTLIVERFENGIRQMGGEDQAKRSLVADLLIKLDKIEEAQPFLLDVEKSKEQKDFQTLMKHIQAYMAKARRTGDSA
ncbi:MAG: hypothetical protein ACOCVL_01630, partial [Candidatus Sumerlaeota bacterium]